MHIISPSAYFRFPWKCTARFDLLCIDYRIYLRIKTRLCIFALGICVPLAQKTVALSKLFILIMLQLQRKRKPRNSTSDLRRKRRNIRSNTENCRVYLIEQKVKFDLYVYMFISIYARRYTV